MISGATDDHFTHLPVCQVRRAVEPQEGRPARYVYHLAELGCEVLQELLREIPPGVARSGNEFQVRVSLFHLLDPPARQEILAAWRAVLQANLAHLDRMVGEAAASGYPYATRVVEFNQGQIQRELEWIEELSQHIEKAALQCEAP